MKTLKDWRLLTTHCNGADLLVEGRHLLRLRFLDYGLTRVSLLRDGAWCLGRTWSIWPDTPPCRQGRVREDDSAFPCPQVAAHEGDDTLSLVGGDMRLRLRRPLCLDWSIRQDGDWHVFLSERPTGSVMLGRTDRRLAHFLAMDPVAPIHGLGERAGPLDRRGRRFDLRALDAMGYDAAVTDPLYKAVPFTLTKGAVGAWSIFYDNLAHGTMDLGQERDNYHAPYRSFRAEDGDLDYYVRWAPGMIDLVRAQVTMTGGTAFPPRWSLGYSGSTMAYTDAPDALDRLGGFLDALERHEIPCDSFHLSSGYTSIGPRRYVFTWNRDKFPEPDALGARFDAASVRLIANVKPCLLDDHPEFQATAPLCLHDADMPDRPDLSAFWDGSGAHLDFTNPRTGAWWRERIRTRLLDHGIGAIWNDNNEYQVWDPDALCNGIDGTFRIAAARPVQTLLMAVESHAALADHAPGQRPFVVSRSAGPGVQALAQTWTGDNRTDWATLRWNQRMGLGLSLSGFFNIGHDVGGFAGPQPDAELLLRWVQNGIFHPRFVIHSWNDDGSVTEPWTHPGILPEIRAAMRLRYDLLPYLYTCLHAAHARAEPILRPVFLDHPADAEAWEECDEFLLGTDLLVATVLDPGARVRPLRLPRNPTGWWDVWTGRWHAPGTRVEYPVDLGTIPLFARAGSVIPMATGARRADPGAETGRRLLIFPPSGEGSATGTLYEDDGVSVDPAFCLTHVVARADDAGIAVSTHREGHGMPWIPEAEIVLPAGETRPLRTPRVMDL